MTFPLSKIIQVLLIEDSPADARMLQVLLPFQTFHIQHVSRLNKGIEACGRDDFDVILLDLSLPDSKGLKTLETLMDAVSKIPIIILTGYDDESIGMEAVSLGAEDYLKKDNLNEALLQRSIKYALYRKQHKIAQIAANTLRAELLKQQELNTMLNDLLTLIAHQFRTPITTLLTSTELLEEYPDQPQPWKSRHLGKIKTETLRINDMINNILSFQSVQSGETTSQPTQVEMVAFCQRSITHFSENYKPFQAIRFKAKCKACYCQIDEQLFHLLLKNLLSNATKFSNHEGEIILSLSANKEFVQITIQDQGRGILPEDQSKVFDLMYRSKEVESIPGIGIGLPIVKKIVEIHRGEVWFETKPEIGSIFSIKLKRYLPNHSSE